MRRPIRRPYPGPRNPFGFDIRMPHGGPWKPIPGTRRKPPFVRRRSPTRVATRWNPPWGPRPKPRPRPIPGDFGRPKPRPRPNPWWL